MGEVAVDVVPDELGFPIEIADITLTECIMLSGFAGSADRAPQYTRGYGLTFGHNERKTMSMAIVDRALRARELGEEVEAPCQDEEFVLYHSDNVEASGFVQHLKLPHYVDFQADLVFLRKLRSEFFERKSAAQPVAAAQLEPAE
jgi:alpha-D-ribose 1-methylphosphonate 5-triphosphate synthase subunit PhnI